jgi:uncharacterized membrane protein
MPAKTSSPENTLPTFRTRSREVSRIEAFSDVVFGFSLTLLVVSTEVPHTFTELMGDMRSFVPFAVCFAIFGQVWWQHHNFFRRYPLDDSITATLNFMLLFVMLFYTYPLKFIFVGMFNQITGHTQVHAANGQLVSWLEAQQGPMLMVVYSIGYATVFAIFVLLYWNALRHKQELELDPIELFDTYTSIWASAFYVGLGILCAAAAVLLPVDKAGLAGFLFFLIPIGRTIIGRRRRQGRRKLAASRTGGRVEAAPKR